MIHQELIRLACENVEAYNAGDWERLKASLAPDVIYDEPGTQRQLQGADQMIAAYRGWKHAAPDGKGVITKAFASESSVTLEVIWTGTQTGVLLGAEGAIPPTGKKWHVLGAQVITIEDGKIVHFRQYFDMLTILQQIGAAAPAAKKRNERN
jgi:steroid delta-isomerase-like uncharacterized protein